MDKLWEFLKDIVPEFKLPDETLLEPKGSAAEMKKDRKVSEIKSDAIPVIKQPEKPEKPEKPERASKGMTLNRLCKLVKDLFYFFAHRGIALGDLCHRHEIESECEHADAIQYHSQSGKVA